MYGVYLKPAIMSDRNVFLFSFHYQISLLFRWKKLDHYIWVAKQNNNNISFFVLYFSFISNFIIILK
jgi:hypothetical protein